MSPINYQQSLQQHLSINNNRNTLEIEEYSQHPNRFKVENLSLSSLEHNHTIPQIKQPAQGAATNMTTSRYNKGIN